MKLIIDIPEDTVKEIKDNAMFAEPIASQIKWDVTGAIVNGTPIPDNATNGNSVIKIFFDGIVRINSRKNVSVEFNKNWWNAPYQKGGKE